MKKMKLAVVFAALVSVFGFSSCLDSGGSGTNPDWTGFVTVKEHFMGDPYLAADDGFEFIPVASSVLAPLKQKDGSYYKRLVVAVKFNEGEIVTEGKTSYKISQLLDYNGLFYKDFNFRPDTLENDYSLVSLDNRSFKSAWAKNGYITLPFTYNVSTTKLTYDDFHMYATDVKDDTLYTRFRQTKGSESVYSTDESLFSFAIPVNSSLYNQLTPKDDSIVIKIMALGSDGKTLVSNVKYKYNER